MLRIVTCEFYKQTISVVFVRRGSCLAHAVFKSMRHKNRRQYPNYMRSLERENLRKISHSPDTCHGLSLTTFLYHKSKNTIKKHPTERKTNIKMAHMSVIIKILTCLKYFNRIQNKSFRICIFSLQM